MDKLRWGWSQGRGKEQRKLNSIKIKSKKGVK